uniref:Band 7 domain-containing protein n=1 Tax=Trieres chinensis TaxID=1514140 RepID=A0A7S1Z6D7_TRICV|mmetsp:Transcript_18739/g.38037  ORF Transcript_18739/g.38037 Transcript_18739/m.38037 type:complete len:557 (+) Transcript_18739:127-1797(+)|eukprot:CAMPEP_0183304586 /NCGR_PEP_ID=MMETSP0160_2-20130417/9628_1 /TAXON_ID=2839 ORGANISM="Odontella Sinensis, Strain Grunow 1884" /NCGR_SAMPLE_ID=MMETSP0160_2 /ASSEMBLY_ACC=CAM_ASM_000250 /LENGTH=556 /DNA_ID=CAMNT_0025467669 /DNA_START=58 /DNA_END=1728 /DNA_ORIENTATION=+
MSQDIRTETLSSDDIPNVGAANVYFGEDQSLMVARPRKNCCAFWFTVPEGFYALVTRHGATELFKDPSTGKETPVWPSGLHLGPPWLKVSHLVTKQSVVFNTPIRGCKTKDNVTVQIDISIVLRVMGDSDRPGDDPQNVYKFVHEVTARGLQAQLVDAQAEAVRTLARSVTHTEVFGLRNVGRQELEGVKRGLYGTSVAPSVQGGIPPAALAAAAAMGPIMEEAEEGTVRGVGAEETKEEGDHFLQEETTQEEKDMIGEHDELDPLEAGFNVETGASITEAMKMRLNKQFKPQGVEILDVAIKQISLPHEIQQQMSQKTMVISQNAEQRMQHKHDMQVLNQTESIKTLKQAIDEQKMELQEDGKQQAMVESLALEEEKAKGEAVEWDITTQMLVDVAMVNAESALTVQRIRDTTKLEAERIIEEAQAKAAITRCEAEAKVKETEAEADYKCAQMQAKGDKAVFHAEGVAAPKNRTLNEYTTSLLRLRAQDALASNKLLVVTGTSGGAAANRLLLADAALRGARSHGGSLGKEERSALLSELAVASGTAKVRLHVGS